MGEKKKKRFPSRPSMIRKEVLVYRDGVERKSTQTQKICLISFDVKALTWGGGKFCIDI